MRTKIQVVYSAIEFLICGKVFQKNNKHQNSVGKYKGKVKDWKCETCMCRLFRFYDQNLGLILSNYFYKKLNLIKPKKIKE